MSLIATQEFVNHMDPPLQDFRASIFFHRRRFQLAFGIANGQPDLEIPAGARVLLLGLGGSA